MIVQRIPSIQITDTHLAVYTHCIYDTESIKKTRKTDANLSRGTYRGQLSTKTRKAIKGRLSNYFNAVAKLGTKYRRKKNLSHNIVTLTLPSKQRHSDNEIKRECLMRWIELAKAKHGIEFYYWVAEKQKNGNLHFHILTDKFMSWEWVRSAWNARIETLGYLDDFEKVHKHRNPNSTDIEKIKNINRTARYVTKYTTKIDQQGGIQGRLHGECDMLRNFSPIVMKMDDEINDVLQLLVDSDALKRIDKDHATIYIGNILELCEGFIPKLYNYYYSLTTYDVMRMYARGQTKSTPLVRKTKAERISCATIDEYYKLVGRSQ